MQMTLKYEVVNMVTTSKLPYKFDLYKLSLDTNAKFNPERFPGLIMKFNGCSITIFKNGKIIITGTKTIPEVENLLDELEKKLKSFQLKE